MTATGAAAEALALASRWQALRASEPTLRIRDAATRLGVSELELLRSEPGMSGCRTEISWLAPRFAELLAELSDVGKCLALTRNEHAVLEVEGRYGGVAIGPHAGQVLGEGIDLRVFLARWRYGVAVRAPHPQRAGQVRRSVQLFDASGTAVHKVYLDADEDPARWDAMVARLGGPTPTMVLVPPRPPAAPRADFDEAARGAFCAAWEAMTDTHELFGLLREHRLPRVQALQAVWPQRARPVAPAAMDQLLTQVAQAGTKIMIFVGNPGCIQIFSGSIERVVRRGSWLNILDEGHSLHLREDRIASAWVVHKPTRTGRVSSLELYDDRGETIAMVFRKRAEGDPAEDGAWTARLAALPRAEALPRLSAAGAEASS